MNDTSALMRTLLWWGIPFAIVVVALGYETDWGRGVAGEAGKPPPVASAQPVPVALLPEYRIEGGAQTRKETVERVLFNPTRRPAPPAAQTAGGPSQMQKGIYALTGTTMVGNVATAFLREVKGGKSHTVRQGDTLSGVVIVDVKPDHIRLKQGDEVEDLALKIASGPKTTIQPATAAVPSAPAAAAPAVRPAAAPANPAASGAQGATSVGELLAERRRAARAAAAAAAGGSADPPPAPAAAPVPAPTANPAPVSQAMKDATAANPGWARVYEGMQQRKY